MRQREAGGPAPTYKPSPKCSTGGEAAVDGIPLQPGMTNYSNTRSVHSDASVGNPKLSRHYERGTSHPEIHFSSNISVASGTPSFMRIRIGGDDGTSVASGSTTDTSSAAGQQRRAASSALEQENRELRFRLERMESMMQQLINAGNPSRLQQRPDNEFETPRQTGPPAWDAERNSGANRSFAGSPSHATQLDDRIPHSAQTIPGRGGEVFIGTPATSQQQPRGKPLRHPRKHSPAEALTPANPPHTSTPNDDGKHAGPRYREHADHEESPKSPTLEYVPPPDDAAHVNNKPPDNESEEEFEEDEPSSSAGTEIAAPQPRPANPPVVTSKPKGKGHSEPRWKQTSITAHVRKGVHLKDSSPPRRSIDNKHASTHAQQQHPPTVTDLTQEEQKRTPVRSRTKDTKRVKPKSPQPEVGPPRQQRCAEFIIWAFDEEKADLAAFLHAIKHVRTTNNASTLSEAIAQGARSHRWEWVKMQCRALSGETAERIIKALARLVDGKATGVASTSGNPRYCIQRECIAYMKWMISTVGIPFKRVANVTNARAPPRTKPTLLSALSVAAATGSWEWATHIAQRMKRAEAEHLLEIMAQVTAKFRAMQEKLRRNRARTGTAELGPAQKIPTPNRRGGKPFIPIQHLPFEEKPDLDPDLDTQCDCIGMLQAVVFDGIPVARVQRALESITEIREDTDLVHAVKLGAETDEWDWTTNQCWEHVRKKHGLGVGK